MQVVDPDAGNGSADALTTDQRAELVQFRREHKQLLMDREIRERAAKFVAKRSACGSRSYPSRARIDLLVPPREEVGLRNG